RTASPVTAQVLTSTASDRPASAAFRRITSDSAVLRRQPNVITSIAMLLFRCLCFRPAIWRKGAEIARAETAWWAGSGRPTGAKNVRAEIAGAGRGLAEIALP